MNLTAAQWLQIIDLVARLLVWLDNQRAKADGRKEADDEANAAALVRVKTALTARDTPDPYADGTVHDPDQRD